MYGVPADLDLSQFKNGALIQLSLGEHQVQFHFHPSGSISVEGKWELKDGSGIVVEGSERFDRGEPIHARRLLGKLVSGMSIDAPRSFSLRFEGGDVLTIYDDSTQYESFSIQPGDIFI